MARPVLQILAPRDVAGWLWRMLVALAVVLLGWVLFALVSYGQITARQMPDWLSTLMFGLLVSVVLLWALAVALRSERRLLDTRCRDPVTGLSNREQFLARALQLTPQRGLLFLLRVDDFEALNDSGGLRAGNLCLMAIALRFRKLTRQTDIIGRLDGAVFAIFLPNAPIDMARDIGKRLGAGLDFIEGMDDFRVSISAGAVMADGRTPVETLMHDAHRALSRAKRLGPARFVLANRPAAV